MWTMGYNDGNDYNKQDSFNGRKLRPLIPRPFSSPNNTSNSSSPLNCLQGNEFFSLNQHMATISDQSKRELNTQPAVVVSSRWNPTPEQLRTLEELYQRGTRTPSADQIQHITAQLRRYGKIEGKNVFYWFQNHKARERQKRRRQMESDAHEQEQDVEILGRKESGSSRTVFEVEQTKNWGSSTNCSTSTEKSVSIQRAAKAAVAEFRPDGWIQFDEEELQPTRSFMERNATWQQMVQLSCPPRTHLINSTNSIPPVPATPNIATPFAIKTISINPTTTPESTTRTMDPKPIKTCNLMNIFIASHNGNEESMMNEEDGCGEESQTLQLFPLRSSASNSESYREKDVFNTEASSVGGATNPNLTSFQFYEFLPPKN